MTILEQFVLVLITITVASAVSLGHLQSDTKQNDDYCFSTDTGKSQLKQFSTKTAYQLVKNLNTQDTAHLIPSKFFYYSKNHFI